jgi:hypothetical protein
VHKLKSIADEWDNNVSASTSGLTKHKIHTHDKVRAFIVQWMHDYTTPSSNSQNVINFTDTNETHTHFIYWRTDTLDILYLLCRLETLKELGQTFKRSFFITCIPLYIRLKIQQDGFCPLYFTGYSLFAKRACSFDTRIVHVIVCFTNSVAVTMAKVHLMATTHS